MLINKDHLLEQFSNRPPDAMIPVSAIRAMIDDMPSIDAVPVVRCKDCAKREYCRTSTVWAVAPDDDWYCADAERKEK